MKKSYKVDIVAGTVCNIGIGHFDLITTDMYMYRVNKEDKALYALKPSLGDVIWVYRAKLAHKVVDLVPYESNEDLGKEPIDYDLDVETN